MHNLDSIWQHLRANLDRAGALTDIVFTSVKPGFLPAFLSAQKERREDIDLNIYLPNEDRNIDFIPADLSEILSNNQFYLIGNTTIDDLSLQFLFYGSRPTEFEIDFYASELKSLSDFKKLIGITLHIARQIEAPKWFMATEGNHDEPLLKSEDIT